MGRLKEIKQLRAAGVTVFCDWEKHIDWLIEQLDTHPELDPDVLLDADYAKRMEKEVLHQNNILDKITTTLKRRTP